MLVCHSPRVQRSGSERMAFIHQKKVGSNLGLYPFIRLSCRYVHIYSMPCPAQPISSTSRRPAPAHVYICAILLATRSLTVENAAMIDYYRQSAMSASLARRNGGGRLACSSIFRSDKFWMASGRGREHRKAMAVESVSRMMLCVKQTRWQGRGQYGCSETGNGQGRGDGRQGGKLGTLAR